MLLLNYSTTGWRAMATVNFSVPDEVKAAFDRAFGDQNKSAIIADLMRKAIADAGLRQRRQEIIRRLTERRAARPASSAAETRAARRAGRP